MSAAHVSVAVAVAAKGQKSTSGSARLEVKLADLERALVERTQDEKGTSDAAQ